MTPKAAARRLSLIDIEATISASLTRQAETIVNAIRDALAHEPGGDHTFPWRQTGALHDSIVAETSGLTATIGSAAPEAAYQEHGTRTDPPRPFLAPITHAHIPQAASDIANAVTQSLSAALKDN